MKKSLLTLSLLATLQTATAQTTLSTVSGSWYDPAYNGSGFNMAEFPNGLFAYFYGYKGAENSSANGQAQWLLTASGIPAPIEKGKTYTVNMVSGFVGNGGRFATKPSTANSGTAAWGTLQLTFNTCSSGVATLNGSDGTLTHNLVKLAGISGLTCQEKTGTTTEGGSTDGGSTAVSTSIIEQTIPASLGTLYTSNFNRYVKYTAPNGKPIHIVAQRNISDDQLLRAYNILSFYLTDYPGSKYGADKSGVANAMANNNAILALLNGQDDGSNPIANQVTGQPLYQNEIQVEGHSWYMNQDYNHRDAAYEEILHLVHDTGIGVDGANARPGALPAYQAEIRKAQKNALNNQLWGIGAASWISELTTENSLSQEYLAAVVDSYYGLWGAYTQSATNGMWGLYVGKTRADEQSDDPMGSALMPQFFHPYITYNARISATLTGNFSLKYNATKPYTNHSRYLKDITLQGSNAVSVTVNELNNNITGNSGMNTVIFSGASSEYSVSKNGTVVTVVDTVANRDGSNILSNVEKLQFSDTTTTL